MEATYIITEHDYIRAMKLFSKITPKIAYIYSIAITILSLAAFFGPPIVKGGAIGGLIGGIVFAFVGRFVVNPFIAKRHYKKYKAIHKPITIRLKDEGVSFETADGEGVIKWENIFKWRQNESYLLIYPMPRLYHIVPKIIVDSGFNLSSLIEALQSHVGKET